MVAANRNRNINTNTIRHRNRNTNTEIQTRGLYQIHDRPVGGGWWRQMREIQREIQTR